jgi:heme-degrading monooxygenase HmoA
MIIQTVKFKSDLSDVEVRRIMENRAPQFRALPGLLQKFYVREADSGEYSGIYIWDGEESLRSFRSSELARSIPAAYRVVGQPRVETFEVLFPLRAAQSNVSAPQD